VPRTGTLFTSRSVACCFIIRLKYAFSSASFQLGAYHTAVPDNAPELVSLLVVNCSLKIYALVTRFILDRAFMDYSFVARPRSLLEEDCIALLDTFKEAVSHEEE
jgi:hypothetical protein